MRVAICHRSCFSEHQIGIHREGCSDIARREGAYPYRQGGTYVPGHGAVVEVIEAETIEEVYRHIEENADDDGDGPIQSRIDCRVFACCRGLKGA